MWRVKLALAGVLIIIITAGLLVLRFGNDDGEKAGGANYGRAFPPDKFDRVPVVEDRLTVAEKLRPARRRTRGEELLADTPTGTEVYEIRAPGDEPLLIYRAPEGEVYVPKGTDAAVKVYRKAAPVAGWERRPAVFGYTDLARVGGGATVGVARLGCLHLGPAAAYDAGRVFSVGAAASYNIWGNLDVGAYGGKAIGRDGWRGGLAVAVALK